MAAALAGGWLAATPAAPSAGGRGGCLPAAASSPAAFGGIGMTAGVILVPPGVRSVHLPAAYHAQHLLLAGGSLSSLTVGSFRLDPEYSRTGGTDHSYPPCCYAIYAYYGGTRRRHGGGSGGGARSERRNVPGISFCEPPFFARDAAIIGSFLTPSAPYLRAYGRPVTVDDVQNRLARYRQTVASRGRMYIHKLRRGGLSICGGNMRGEDA